MFDFISEDIRSVELHSLTIYIFFKEGCFTADSLELHYDTVYDAVVAFNDIVSYYDLIYHGNSKFYWAS